MSVYVINTQKMRVDIICSSRYNLQKYISVLYWVLCKKCILGLWVSLQADNLYELIYLSGSCKFCTYH